jgi:hypothetical protein
MKEEGRGRVERRQKKTKRQKGGEERERRRGREREGCEYAMSNCNELWPFCNLFFPLILSLSLSLQCLHS